MADTKIKIDLLHGLLEAEGSEAFVKSIYEDFKERIQVTHSSPVSVIPEKTKKNPSKASASSNSKPAKRKTNSNTPSLVKDLDLKGGSGGKSLSDFYNQYSPNSNLEKNLIFAYYLQQEIKLNSITVDHIFTCYRNVSGIKTPGALQQSLIDTARNKGWLDTTSLSDIKVSIVGINHIEHDMKKASE